MIAASEGHVQILDYLLDHHADINLTNDVRTTINIILPDFVYIDAIVTFINLG